MQVQKICGYGFHSTGVHRLSSSGRFPRQHSIIDILKRAFCSADIPVIFEPVTLCRDVGKRPNEVTLPKKNGKVCLGCHVFRYIDYFRLSKAPGGMGGRSCFRFYILKVVKKCFNYQPPLLSPTNRFCMYF